jgi:hypothetical protein
LTSSGTRDSYIESLRSNLMPTEYFGFLLFENPCFVSSLVMESLVGLSLEAAVFDFLFAGRLETWSAGALFRDGAIVSKPQTSDETMNINPNESPDAKQITQIETTKTNNLKVKKKIPTVTTPQSKLYT